MNNFPLNLLTLPIWWYTRGLTMAWRWYQRRTNFALQSTGLALFARHMWEPLYQDYTKSGRILSFFLRIAVLCYKALISGLSLLYYGLFLLVYVSVLPAVLVMIIFQILSHA